MWLAASCTSIGFGYPGDLNASEFAERWMDKNLRLMEFKSVLNAFIRNGNSKNWQMAAKYSKSDPVLRKKQRSVTRMEDCW